MESNFNNWYSEKQPWFDKIEKIDKEFVTYSGSIKQHEARLKKEEEETGKMWAVIKKYKDLEHQTNTNTTQIQSLAANVNELEHIWLFYQRFIDEQGGDKVLKIRGGQYGWEKKFNAVEWLARYIEYLNEDIIFAASQHLRVMFLEQPGESVGFISCKHRSEAIPTIIQKLNSKTKT